MLFLLITTGSMKAQRIDYSPTVTEDERDLGIEQMTANEDVVYMPDFKRSSKKVNWLTNRVMNVSPDGKRLAFLSDKDGTMNIFVKEIENGIKSPALQRSNRALVLDFTYSPDGKSLLFTDVKGADCQVCRTDAHEGYACEILTVKQVDYSPIYCTNGKEILFSRQQKNTFSIYRYNTENHNMTVHSIGTNPCPIPGENTYVCCRLNKKGKNEIWKVNMETGEDICLVTDPKRNFSTPVVSPDGKWMAFVGENIKQDGNKKIPNTDIFVCRTNGETMIQLTNHVANDLSPAWSPDGKHLYFISQRGNAKGVANIWRMNLKN